MNVKLVKMTVLICLIFILSFCRSPIGNEDNPVPVLESISPTSALSHMQAFTLTVRGNNFVVESRIIFNGTAKETTFVDGTTLTCTIEPGDTVLPVSSAGASAVKSTTAAVSVFTPGPGGGDSGGVEFTILSNPTFNDPKLVSPPGRIASYFYPASVSPGPDGSLDVCWEEVSIPYSGIYFTTSTDQGETWSDAQKIVANITGYPFAPVMVTDGSGSVFVAWRDYSFGNPDIYVCGSADNGGQWTDPVNISDNDGYSNMQSMARNAEGYLFAVWEDHSSDIDGVYFSRSLDSGATWTTPSLLSPESAYPHSPDIAVDGEGKISVCWRDSSPTFRGVSFTRSENNGETWIPVKILAHSFALSPRVAAYSSGRVAVIFDSRDIIKVVYSLDGGETWNGPVNITDGTFSVYNPRVIGDDLGNLNLVWNGHPENKSDVFYSRSIDHGASWSQPVNVSNTGDQSAIFAPNIGLDQNGYPVAVWTYLHPNGWDWQLYVCAAIH
jgi:hypothetical protein